MSTPVHAYGYEMVAPGAPPRRTLRHFTGLAYDEALIEVAGCGICHTDLGFLDHGVRTRHALPLILGHEISGVVQAAGHQATHLVGRPVVVPAVIPCGKCPECKAGRSMICKHQVFPGNDRDGGWASHVVVPAHALCEVPGASTDPDEPLPGQPELTLRHLAVIADAVSTPFAALTRANVGEGDVVIVVGLGGVGGYCAQIAAALGAFVVGLDVSEAKLAMAASLGCGLALDPRADDARALKKRIGEWVAAQGGASTRWVIAECSGTVPGQRTAWGLLVHGAKLLVVGYTMDSIELRLSNLMAFDAEAIGNWGCPPELYPAVVRLVLDGKIDLASHTVFRPLDNLVEALHDVRTHAEARRVVLVP
ncbi:MAG: 6-hydroxycyclohex-1-ene-1-carbonyl-CoA dehydrogenase [Deltaproteobacteria bacterium]|nr:6-hydroxycyclohex-1-ene-1-carbonyl-CoA dehydrogenase [Deltaproteobacteria bacterium]